jgi:hypothetical protein
LDTQPGDIGFVLLDDRLRFDSICCLGDDLNIRCALQQLADPGADNVMVIRQKDADSGFGFAQ